jgi:RNA polymerase sigma-70 factor (ECF subfamily)
VFWRGDGTIERYSSVVEGKFEGALADLLPPLERELRAYAYRMLGGYADAEDAVQEASIRAWKSFDSLVDRSSFRAWMYRIVSNVCYDVLRTRKRRALPEEIGPSVSPGPPRTERRDDLPWLEPYPDVELPEVATPEATLRLRESIRLAFVHALQSLPERQRAALILHDVLDWSVGDVAGILDTSDAAINSALQRARDSVRRPEADVAVLRKREADTADTLARYVRAWETGDFDEVVTMLAEDVRLSMPPWQYWIDGKEQVAAAFTDPETWSGPPRPGHYRHVTMRLNGAPAALAYIERDGAFRPVCLSTLRLDATGKIDHVVVFVLPQYFAQWGFPATL